MIFDIPRSTGWLPREKILFGGCLVRSANARQLGNLQDAVVNEWDTTITKILNTYPEVETVVPGHGACGSKNLLHYTIDLVKAHTLEP